MKTEQLAAQLYTLRDHLQTGKQVAKTLRGKVLSYHNHDIEFRRVKGRLILEYIFDNTDANNLKGELDTH